MAKKQTRQEIDKEQMYKKLMPTSPRVRDLEEDDYYVPEEVAAPRRAAPARREIPVPAMRTQRLALVNTMEDLVLGKLDSAMMRMKCCKCDRCKKDIVALALNKLPPRYCVMDGGNTPTPADPKLNAQVVTAIIQAILIVRNHPRH